MKEKNCVMIEVGRTGLTMGYLLKETGWKITILEARDRIGGRVFTYHFRANPDWDGELGGEWVGRDYDRVIDLCDEFGLNLIPHQFDSSFVRSAGRSSRHFRRANGPSRPSCWQRSRRRQEPV